MVEEVKNTISAPQKIISAGEEYRFSAEYLANKYPSAASMMADLDAKINAFTNQWEDINKEMEQKL